MLEKVHPVTRRLPLAWETKDECYYFKEINPAVHVLLVSDISYISESNNEVNPDVFGDHYPSSWCHYYEGGKAWFTALGHDKKDYSNPQYLLHILVGLKWVLDNPALDYSKAQATRSGYEMKP